MFAFYPYAYLLLSTLILSILRVLRLVWIPQHSLKMLHKTVYKTFGLLWRFLDFHNKVTTSETLISDYKVRSQVRNNVKSSLIMVYYLY